MPTVYAIKIIVIFLSVSCFLFAGCGQSRIKRVGQVIGIKKANIEEYKKLHADAWPGVLKMIDKANIHNYSIYLGATEKDTDDYYLFSYFEYTGKDFDADMAIIAADETTQKWWKETDPLQSPLPTHKEGEWWSPWKEVFHHGGPAHNCKNPKRLGSIIGIEKENILAYTQMHASVWPGVLEAIDNANIRNYSIYLGQIKPGEYLLFSYFEYVGDDFDKDMKDIANEVTKKWWSYTDPLQIQLPTRAEGANWADIEEVFYTD